jgi:hypothetical protein
LLQLKVKFINLISAKTGRRTRSLMYNNILSTGNFYICFHTLTTLFDVGFEVFPIGDYEERRLLGCDAMWVL